MALENTKKLFDIKNEFSKHEIMDEVKFVYKCYQYGNLPDGFYELSADKDGNVNGNSRAFPHIGKKPIVYSLLDNFNIFSQKYLTVF